MIKLAQELFSVREAIKKKIGKIWELFPKGGGGAYRTNLRGHHFIQVLRLDNTSWATSESKPLKGPYHYAKTFDMS